MGFLLPFSSLRATVAFLASLIVVTANDRPFTYANQSTDEGYGLYSWSHVEPPQYYFNWSRYTNTQNISSNRCRRDGRQSPINIVEPEGNLCNGTLPFDKHRWQTDHGNCSWIELEWEIKPWGLFMQFPMLQSGNFQETPCRKPSINSSGGLVDRFFATHLTIKAKSEHHLLGKQYDAEINIAHTRYYDEAHFFGDPYNETVFMASILVHANDTNGDNPILEPYLREWMRVYYNISTMCDPFFDPLSIGLPSIPIHNTRNNTFGQNVTDNTTNAEWPAFPIIPVLNITNTTEWPGVTTQLFDPDVGTYGNYDEPMDPNSSRRNLQDDGITNGFMQGTWAMWPEFDMYQLLTTPWFYRYTGTLTMPDCFKTVFWRILEHPLEISTRQLEMINQMISNARDPATCSSSTVGLPREDGSGYVDVNRPLFDLPDKNDLMHCDKHDFPSTKFFYLPRGNTRWSLLEQKNLSIPDSYWWETYEDYNVTSFDGPGNVTALTEAERNATDFYLLYGTLLTSGPSPSSSFSPAS